MLPLQPVSILLISPSQTLDVDTPLSNEYDMMKDFPCARDPAFRRLDEASKGLIENLEYPHACHQKGEEFGLRMPPLAAMPCAFPGFEALWQTCVDDGTEDAKAITTGVDIPKSCLAKLYSDPDMICLCEKIIYEAAVLTRYRRIMDRENIIAHFEHLPCIAATYLGYWIKGAKNNRSGTRNLGLRCVHRCQVCNNKHPLLMLEDVSLLCLGRFVPKDCAELNIGCF